MAQITTLPAGAPAPRVAETFEALFLVCFVVVFFIALAAQVLFLKWRTWLPGAEGEKSLIKAVRSGVYTFLSHLN